MAVSGRPEHHYTYAEYVALELDSSTKHEYCDGEIYAMAGGSADHAALSANMIIALGAVVDDRGCCIYTSDLRIYVESVGLATFPDGSVVCGPVEHHGTSPADTATNPSLLIEVTSNSSETYDTGFKLEVYKTIPSLREVVLVSHRERRITIHRRADTGDWMAVSARTGERVLVETLGVELVVDQIYRRTSIS